MRQLLASPALYAAAMYGATGIGFASANLLLARFLAITDFALVTLLMALLNVSIPLATAGMEGVVNRRTLDLGPRMLRRVLITSTVVAALAVATGRIVYGLEALFLLVLFPSVVAGGATFLAAAHFQSVQRFTLSIFLNQHSNYLFLIAAVAMVAFGIYSPYFPFLVMLMGYLATAAWAWLEFCKKTLREGRSRQEFPWREALFYAGIQAAGLLLLGMERLLVPKLLTLADLATFGVLSAVALAPFRILELAVGYTLLPRLRATADVATRRTLLAYEAAIVGATGLVASLVVWYLAPPIAALFVGQKYELPSVLLLAAIVAGSIRVAASIPRASATALCSTRQLGYLAVLMWLSVGCSFVGAVVGARWGLVGIIYGVTFGWGFRGVAAACVAARHLRRAD
jgi:O-antigen/teichoic acid export membrane protein